MYKYKQIGIFVKERMCGVIHRNKWYIPFRNKLDLVKRPNCHILTCTNGHANCLRCLNSSRSRNQDQCTVCRVSFRQGFIRDKTKEHLLSRLDEAAQVGYFTTILYHLYNRSRVFFPDVWFLLFLWNKEVVKRVEPARSILLVSTGLLSK